MLRDGQKWACDSCIRGHRVSNCNHHDRELKMIAPKGRPVKQCEHCRSARKDKSHHAKCDCGSKKLKDVPESEPTMESMDCCCHKGHECVCGIKSEMADRRQETILRRRTMPVKSKPCLSSSNSDQSLPGLNGPKHKPVHNTHGQALMTPYPKPSRSARPNSIHNLPYSRGFPESSDGDIPRSVDDMTLLSTSNKTYGANYASQLSADSVNNYTELDYNPFLLGSEDGSGSVLSRTTSAEALSVTTGWFDSSLTTVTEIPDFSTSPSHVYFDNDADWNIPSATTDFFSPSDLPLISQVPDSFQTISLSGESNYQSAPPLTASSSGAQSEIGEPLDSGCPDIFPNFWSGTVGIRDSWHSAGSIEYGIPRSLPSCDSGLKQKPKLIRHRQTYSSGSISRYAHHLSDQTTVPDNVPSLAGINIGHLQNLAYSDHSATQSASPEYPPVLDGDFGAISIPAGIDDSSYRDDWYLGMNSTNETDSKEYSWLLDSA
ncbi:Copper fist DNA-binding protein [Venturia nashicola]|uniref:Copper fist DNA-binding protein n=1 Tax=Venturia nashicola TaxID=86259 RepID=A0A4Z1NX90_9PEZI|nr:Copper fist DNA-binding protein [Venturia nashicola]TLD32415.1 Copper fist DNA-binding protein [Venturia nashicola]